MRIDKVCGSCGRKVYDSRAFLDRCCFADAHVCAGMHRAIAAGLIASTVEARKLAALLVEQADRAERPEVNP